MNEEVLAEKMAKEMKEISVAEFFEKNRHFLGYENPTKSLLTVVKEAIDNSIEFATEAGILPDIFLSVKEIGIDKFKVIIEDNGPGVIKEQIPKAFGRVLYGSRFHKLKQSRSLFGIGIKGACLYAQLTTGKPIKIISGIGKGAIHIFELMIDVAKNEPIVVSYSEKENPNRWHGIRIEMEVEGRYVERSQSILEYLKQTAMANPFVNIVFDGPNGKVEFKRSVKELPKKPKEIKPHPYGVELGLLRRMLSSTKAKSIISFLTTDFSRIGKSSAEQICRLAKIEPNKNPKGLSGEESERLHKAMQMIKIKAPPSDCLSPLEEKMIVEGLKKELKAEYYVAIKRPPSVYRGFPFQVSVGLAYGGELPENQTCQLYRFANNIPLLYHQGDCAITQAVSEVDFRRYGISQSSGQLPVGPLAILVHIASVWIPFTTEGKQAIAPYPEILKEVKLALQDAGRKLAKFVAQKRRLRERALRRQIFERYIPEVASALAKLTNKSGEEILKKMEEVIKKKMEEKI